VVNRGYAGLVDQNVLKASACDSGHVDISASRHPQDVLHVRADEFGAFVRDIKNGRYDSLCPPATDPEENDGKPRLRSSEAT
jgi:hypothetical protein